MPPAARITDMHTCPMVTPGVPPIPHVGGPILPAGCPTVLIGNLPAARVGDIAVCVGPPDVIVKGSMTVVIGNMPAARMGDQTAHGGVIVVGFPTVMIGDSGHGSAGGGGAGGSGPSATTTIPAFAPGPDMAVDLATAFVLAGPLITAFVAARKSGAATIAASPATSRDSAQATSVEELVDVQRDAADHLATEPAKKTPDCKSLWSDAERSTKEICKETDPIRRNKAISAAYATAYLETPQLEWFGAAAFASKQVGCGMTHAVEVSHATLPKITDAVGITKGSGPLAEATLQKLGDGNKAVFEEMLPAQKFYKKNGLDALKRCASQRNPPLPGKVLDGFEQADEGHRTNNPTLIHKGAETMLWQEQRVTLQKAAYDDALLQKSLALNQKWSESWLPTFGLAQPTKVVFDSACSTDGAPSFQMSGGNLGDPEWRWSFAKGTTQKFSDLAAKQPDAIGRALGEIAAGRP